jgi:GABA(A) receptor-associated protein
MTQNKEEFEFDIKVPFEERKKEVEKQLKNHPGKIPIVVQKSSRSKLVLPDTFKFKFLVPPEQTFGSFMYEIRKRLRLTEEQSLFVFAKNLIPASGNTMGDIYEKFKDDDGFLKLIFCEENTFGKHIQD